MTKPTGNSGSGRDAGKRVTIACPHCRAALRVRTSWAETSIVRQFIMACFNPECGATFGAALTITHAISPSAAPDESVHLRQAPARQRPAPANDDLPPSATAPAGPEVPAANDEAISSTG